MLHWLIDSNFDFLDDHGLGFLRVFRYATFRGIASIILSFFIVIILGPRVIRWLRSQKISDLAQFDQGPVDEMLKGKKGTPTMGGLLITAAIGLTTLLIGDLFNFYVRMALICMAWLAAVGAADDWLKLTVGRRQNSRQGLSGREKLLFQIGLAVLLALFTWRHGGEIEAAHTIYFPFFKNLQLNLQEFSIAIPGTTITLGLLLFVALSTVVLTGTSNAVNLTDGLDGLAGGCMGIVSFAFFLLCLIIGTATRIGVAQPMTLANYLYLPHIPTADELAVVAGAMTGACLGFLWFNCNPAAVFMGDTGSLALGGLIGYIAIVVRQELLLFVVGGVFVLEAVSVIVQVSYFKYTRRRYGEGRRIFLMSPIHLHFLKKGWTESQVVVRFWLITAMLAAISLATVKLR